MVGQRLFRLFLSSTFSDFIAEREALQDRVFPELERYCAEQGVRFEAIDLRWGITEEDQRNHDTMRICLEEIRRCQQLSPRPNFAVLIGDRYGWEPVPARKTKVDSVEAGLNSNNITDTDLVNLTLAPWERVTVKTLKPLSDVFAALREWAENPVRARLDSSDFKGSTWTWAGVFVMSAHSPRARQEVRRYSNVSYAHQDRFSVITRFPKAIASLLKKMINEVLPESFMDKDYFYNEVARAIAAAEQRDEPLIDILLVGIDRAQELARDASAT